MENTYWHSAGYCSYLLCFHRKENPAIITWSEPTWLTSYFLTVCLMDFWAQCVYRRLCIWLCGCDSVLTCHQTNTHFLGSRYPKKKITVKLKVEARLDVSFPFMEAGCFLWKRDDRITSNTIISQNTQRHNTNTRPPATVGRDCLRGSFFSSCRGINDENG